MGSVRDSSCGVNRISSGSDGMPPVLVRTGWARMRVRQMGPKQMPTCRWGRRSKGAAAPPEMRWDAPRLPRAPLDGTAQLFVERALWAADPGSVWLGVPVWSHCCALWGIWMPHFPFMLHHVCYFCVSQPFLLKDKWRFPQSVAQ